MNKTRFRPVVRKLDETEVGKILAADPLERKRHEEIVASLRQAVRPELEALERSERPGHGDWHEPIFC